MDRFHLKWHVFKTLTLASYTSFLPLAKLHKPFGNKKSVREMNTQINIKYTQTNIQIKIHFPQNQFLFGCTKWHLSIILSQNENIFPETNWWQQCFHPLTFLSYHVKMFHTVSFLKAVQWFLLWTFEFYFNWFLLSMWL